MASSELFATIHLIGCCSECFYWRDDYDTQRKRCENLDASPVYLHDTPPAFGCLFWEKAE